MNTVIYSRVSTGEQDNERQINELKEYITYKKYTLLGVFEEKITGATKAAERIEFKRLLDFIDNNPVNCLMVWELSRLGRRTSDILNTIDAFTEKKINIYSHKENLNTLNAKGEKEIMTTVLTSILGSIAELERDTIRLRTKSGIRQSVINGGSGTGNIMPFGFKKVDKKLVIDPNEAEIVKLIFQKYLDGLGTKQLANYMNNQRIPTRFNTVFGAKEVKLPNYNKRGSDFKWVDGTLHTMLKNPIYKGHRQHKGETFLIDAIIDEATFDKVQSTLKSKFNRKDINRKYTNIFKAKILCGKCGLSYFMHKRADNRDNAYKCLSHRYSHSCGNPSISIDKLNNAVYNMIVSYIAKSAQINKQKAAKSVDKKLANLQTDINNTIKALERNNRQEKNLIQLRIDESISHESYTSLYNEILAEKATLGNRLQKFQNEADELTRVESALKNVAEFDITVVQLFKEYVNEAIEYIKIDELPTGTYDFVDNEYKVKKDVVLMITIKHLADEFLYKTVISQRSNIQFLFVRVKNESTYRIPQPKFRYTIVHVIQI